MVIIVNFSLLQHKDLHTFGKQVLDIFKEKNVAGTGIDTFLVRVQDSYSIYEKAFEREQKSPFTKLLAQKDAERDEGFLAFRNYVESCSHRNKEGWNAASMKIQEVIRRHGWNAVNLGYKAETSAITSISAELRTGFTAELTLLSATELLDELDQAQTAFETLQKEILTQPQPEGLTIVETRPELVKNLKSLFGMLGLQCEATGNTELKAIETSLNELITLTLAAARAAATRKANQKTEPEPKP